MSENNNNSTKKQVFSGVIWRFSERILAQLVTFVVTVVLARLLDPESYGAIAIVNIFIALANVFVTSGFGNSLVQKKDADDTDFSTVFYFGIGAGIIFYMCVFFAAPFIASFYNMKILTPVLRVMGLRLVLAGVNSVQHAYVSRKMMFRKFFWSTSIGTMVSAVAGITMAYMGFGVWALVGQYMANSIIDTFFLWFTVKWRPQLKFSFSRLQGLFSYGWKILVASLVRTGYKEVRGIVIGKMYSPSDLAYYDKGKGFPGLVTTNIYVAVQSVIFPAMARVQNEIEQLKAMTRRLVRLHSYLVLPLLLGLALVAEPVIKLLLTEKWISCVPFLQAFCIVLAFEPIQTANLQAIKAVGRSDIYLKLEVIKKTIGIIIIIISARYGVWAIAMGEVVAEVVAAAVNIYPNKKYINYGYMEQIRDLFNAIIPLALMCTVVMFLNVLKLEPLAELAVKVPAGAVAYLGGSVLFRNDSFLYVWNYIVKRK